MRYAALLRGVNVGKSVKVSMPVLRSIAEQIGCSNVATYLNSGNLIFDSGAPKSKIEGLIETGLEKVTGQKIPVLLKSSVELQRIGDALPDTWKNDDCQKTDVAYLFPDADNEKILESFMVQKEVVDIRYVQGAVFWNLLRTNYNKSRINKIINHPLYENMTIRNCNTARQLARLTNT